MFCFVARLLQLHAQCGVIRGHHNLVNWRCIMLALSIRQPYAELILRGIKTVEYRTRPTRIQLAAVHVVVPGLPVLGDEDKGLDADMVATRWSQASVFWHRVWG